MKFFIDDKEIFELSPTQMNLLRHLIPAHQVEDHITGLVQYIVGQKLRDSAIKLFEEWKPKMFAEGIKEVPLADLDLAELIFKRPDYITRATDYGNAETPTPDTLPNE